MIILIIILIIITITIIIEGLNQTEEIKKAKTKQSSHCPANK